MGSALEDYGMTLQNNDTLVCGGVTFPNRTSTSNCTLYVSAVNNWQTFPPLPMGVAGFAMITLQDSRPYVFGGVDNIVYNTVYS